MQSGAITKNQLSASSDSGAPCVANQGRLYNERAWCGSRSDPNLWLQIDLLKDLTVTGVATQGRSGNDQSVTEYKLQYSYDGTNFQYYKEFGRNTDKVRYLILAKFREYKILRKIKCHISRVLNFAILITR